VFDVNNPYIRYESAMSNFKSNEFEYRVGEGEHYFKTIGAAYYYRDKPENQRFGWVAWDDNGKKCTTLDR
jgi:hypothetical protein